MNLPHILLRVLPYSLVNTLGLMTDPIPSLMHLMSGSHAP